MVKIALVDTGHLLVLPPWQVLYKTGSSGRISVECQQDGQGRLDIQPLIRRFVKLPARAIQVRLSNKFQSLINIGAYRFIQAKITGVAPYHSTWTGSARFSNKVSAIDCWKTTYVVVEARLL